LILTAIVIGFALLAFIFILFFSTYETLGTVDTEAMTDAEPFARMKIPAKKEAEHEQPSGRPPSSFLYNSRRGNPAGTTTA
jgi:hypothetical protein